MSKAYFSRHLILRPEEEIEIVARASWISIFWEIVIAVVLILGAFFLMFPLFTLGEIGVSIFVALLVTGIFYSLREFLKWYFNVFIITTQRIIDIDRRGFFQKTVSELPFEKVQDVSYSTSGIIQTFLRLGNIKVQSSSNNLALFIQNVPNPQMVNNILTDLIKDLTGRQVKVTQVAEAEMEQKEQAKADFFQTISQDQEKEYDQDLKKYHDYDLNELVEDYKSTFGEAELKKLLVDELDAFEKNKLGKK